MVVPAFRHHHDLDARRAPAQPKTNQKTKASITDRLAAHKTGFLRFLTVIDAQTNKVLFAGNSRDKVKIERVAAEGARLRPGSRILTQPPMGADLYEWSAD